MKPPDSFVFQVSFKSADDPFPTMKSLSKAVIKSVLPDAKFHKVTLREGEPGLMPLLYTWAQRAASVFYVWVAESESSKILNLSNFI
jgi:hypothetical protein